MCRGLAFMIAASRFYQGDEATLQMLGIASPAIKAQFRCPVYDPLGASERERSVRSAASRYPEHIYFEFARSELSKLARSGSRCRR